MRHLSHRALVLVLLLSVASQAVAAQATPPARPPAPARPGEVETDPIRCWWKTDRTSVRVGERFTLVLTCGVIEAGRTTVVLSTSQLEGGAIQLTPFEVVSTVRRDDILAPPWRYAQFEYAVRILNDGFFGQDVNIPALTVTYNIQAPGGGTQGRDQNYVLPVMPMRVLSLVPRAASDVRDASNLTFGDVESRRFLSSAWYMGAASAFAFALLLAILAAVRVARTFRSQHAADTVPPLGSATLLGGCLTALGALKSEVASAGWSPGVARRGLAALRVAAAAGLGRPVTQDVVDRRTVEREGQIAVRRGWLGRGRALVSAATTPLSMAPGFGETRSADPKTRQSLDQLSGSLGVLSAVAYGRGEPTDTTALDAALSDGIDAVRRLRAGAQWPMRTIAAVAKTIGL